MKAVVLTGIRELGVVDVPKPAIKNDTGVLIEIKSVGICGSDVHYYETGRIGSQVVEYPYIVGHECAGIVAEVGNAVAGLKPGDRIAVDPAVSCHNCDQCNAGRENTCRNLSFLGTPGQGDGCLCEYIVIPAESCFKISDSMSFNEAVITEPFAISYYAVKQSLLKAGQNIAIFGSGPIGLSCLAAARPLQAGKIYMTEIVPERIKAASNAGADWVGNPQVQNVVEEICNRQPFGVDIAFECAGQQKTIDQAVEILKPGGKLMLIGIPRENRISFSIDKLRRKEIAIINIRRQNKCTQTAVDLIAAGKVDVKFMATHHFTIEKSKEGFDMVADYKDGVIKAFIEF